MRKNNEKTTKKRPPKAPKRPPPDRKSRQNIDLFMCLRKSRVSVRPNMSGLSGPAKMGVSTTYIADAVSVVKKCEFLAVFRAFFYDFRGLFFSKIIIVKKKQVKNC